MTQPDHLSKLPDDPGYWARLGSRVEGAVLADLAEAGRAGSRASPAWYAPLARRAWMLSAAAAVAALALSFLPRGDTPSDRAPAAPLLVSPSADAGLFLPLMVRESPPGVAELLVTTAQSRNP